MLLIEVFSKLFNTQNYGHSGSIPGGFFYNAGDVFLHSWYLWRDDCIFTKPHVFFD
jgi:hypothetical protein